MKKLKVDLESVTIDVKQLEKLTRDSLLLAELIKSIKRIIEDYCKGYYKMYNKKISNDIKKFHKKVDESSKNYGCADAFRLIANQLPVIIETKLKELSK